MPQVLHCELHRADNWMTFITKDDSVSPPSPRARRSVLSPEHLLPGLVPEADSPLPAFLRRPRGVDRKLPGVRKVRERPGLALHPPQVYRPSPARLTCAPPFTGTAMPVTKLDLRTPTDMTAGRLRAV